MQFYLITFKVENYRFGFLFRNFVFLMYSHQISPGLWKRDKLENEGSPGKLWRVCHQWARKEEYLQSGALRVVQGNLLSFDVTIFHWSAHSISRETAPGNTIMATRRAAPASCSSSTRSSAGSQRCWMPSTCLMTSPRTSLKISRRTLRRTGRNM